MGLLDRFKKRKADIKPEEPQADIQREKKDTAPKKTAKSKAKPVDAEKKPKKETQPSTSTAKPVEQKKDTVKATADEKATSLSHAHRVLLQPVISEKSAHLHSMNQYVFLVDVRVNKVEIRKAIKELYNAEPTSIRIIRMPGKTVTRGRYVGRTRQYKKAIVCMPKGVELPVYEGV